MVDESGINDAIDELLGGSNKRNATSIAMDRSVEWEAGERIGYTMSKFVSPSNSADTLNVWAERAMNSTIDPNKIFKERATANITISRGKNRKWLYD
jgi:hypothetical protein